MTQLLEGCRSLRVPDTARARTRIDSVVIIGSTCAGKTTLLDAIRDSELVSQQRVVIPPRFITRPGRHADCTTENVHLSLAEFEAKVESDEIDVSWVRHMESGREERYGFPPTPSGQLPVYSGNNAVYAKAARIRPARALDNAFLIGVYAPDPVRERRLRERSPDLYSECCEEVAYRLADRSDSILPHVDVIIDNHGALEAAALVDIVQIVGRIADLAAGRG